MKRKNLLFCEQKRSKKNFISLMGLRPVPQDGNQSFFASFCSQKEVLSFFFGAFV
jgi:hypothetical protein